MTAKLLTPGRIAVLDLADARLEKAKRVRRGRDDQQRHAPTPVAEVMELTEGLGADVAIEAVGVPETFELCTELIRPGGRVANVGVHGHPATLHLERLWIRGVTITTGLVDTFTTPKLLRLVAEGRLDPTAFATHRFELDEIDGGLRHVRRRGKDKRAEGRAQRPARASPRRRGSGCGNRLAPSARRRARLRTRSTSSFATGRRSGCAPPRAGDAAALVEFLSGLSEQSLYYRFHGYPSVDRAARRAVPRARLARDGPSRRASSAGASSRSRATSRLRDPAAAEVAFVVADELQRRGIGTRLLEQLAARAAAVGIERFVAEVLPGEQADAQGLRGGRASRARAGSRAERSRSSSGSSRPRPTSSESTSATTSPPSPR